MPDSRGRLTAGGGGDPAISIAADAAVHGVTSTGAMATVVVEDAPAASARSSVLTLINSSIGAGIVALPLAFSCTGWAGGLVAVAFIACTEGFTLYVLARCAESTGARTYGALVRLPGTEACLHPLGAGLGAAATGACGCCAAPS